MNKADRVKQQMEESNQSEETDAQPAEQFDVAQTGPHNYTVTSHRGDTPRAHRVSVLTVRCSCEDMTFNKSGSSVQPESQGGVEICDHLEYVLSQHPQLTAEEMALYETMGLMRQADSLRDQLEMQADRFEQTLTELRDLEAGAAAETPEESDTANDPDENADAEAAAERLQEAFDNVLEDMQVETAAGHVWFKTGYDTAEEWPFPGGDETFSVITGPDSVKYVHDGSAEWADSPHPLNDDKPGEYWKNALAPDDVEDYISEVLE